MKNRIFYLFACILLFGGCEKMNDKHDKYLAEGETIYIGKVDSVKAFSGDERIVFRYWLGDPRAKTVSVSWANGKDSYTVSVPPHVAIDSFEFQIGKNEKSITEGNYTFYWISKDDAGNTSVTFEKNANVYGSNFRSRLSDHIIINAESVGNNVVVGWGGSTSEQETGVEIEYVDRSGITHIENHPVTALTTTTLENVDFNIRPKYRTKFLPEANAIDTFYTEPTEIAFSEMVNVALGKPVTASDILDPANALYQPENAVDGKWATSDPRWVSTASGDHWLEIDLQGEYTINGFKTWNGSANYTTSPITGMTLQAWVGGVWIDIHSVSGNADGQYGADFTPVTTTKVKFIARSQTRLYEIAIYSIIRY
jgi:hypothetical protein